MIYALHNSRQRLGINASILKTIQEYRQPVPVDYLAKLYGRHVEDMQPYIDRLEEENLIRVSIRKNRQYVQQK